MNLKGETIQNKLTKSPRYHFSYKHSDNTAIFDDRPGSPSSFSYPSVMMLHRATNNAEIEVIWLMLLKPS